jgi:hypothetical protein
MCGGTVTAIGTALQEAWGGFLGSLRCAQQAGGTTFATWLDLVTTRVAHEHGQRWAA